MSATTDSSNTLCYPIRVQGNDSRVIGYLRACVLNRSLHVMEAPAQTCLSESSTDERPALSTETGFLLSTDTIVLNNLIREKQQCNEQGWTIMLLAPPQESGVALKRVCRRIKKEGWQVIMLHPHRYWPPMARLKEITASGVIGPAVNIEVETTLLGTGDNTDWYQHIDLIRWLGPDTTPELQEKTWTETEAVAKLQWQDTSTATFYMSFGNEDRKSVVSVAGSTGDATLKMRPDVLACSLGATLPSVELRKRLADSEKVSTATGLRPTVSGAEIELPQTCRDALAENREAWLIDEHAAFLTPVVPSAPK